MNPATTSTPPRRARWPWLLVPLVLLMLFLLAGVALVEGIADLGTLPVHVVIDGDEVLSLDAATLGAAHPVAIVIGLLVALLAVALVVPVALGIAFAAVVFGLVVGLGVPLLIALLLGGVLLSPLLLPVALGVWLWRRSARPPAANIAP